MRTSVVLAALSLMLSAGVAGAAEQKRSADGREGERPNIVLIISDDQAWDHYSFMGHEHIETPNIDELANEGMTFTRGYVSHALCRASLMTMATGLYPHQHKTVGNDPANEVPQKLSDLIGHVDVVPTVPRMLRRSNYLSHQSGKWWEGSYLRGGFTHGMTHGFPNPGGRHGDRGLKIGREGMRPIFDFIDEAQQRNRPFFLWYAPFMPHTPHNPPDRLLDKYKKRTDSIHKARYWAMCEWFDETCGTLLNHLDDEGLTSNTLVLFIADNGWIQQPDSGGYAKRSKRTVYEGGVRTPVIVRWPGEVEPGTNRTTPVSNVDLAPTILRAAGVEPTDRMRGIDLTQRQSLKKRDAAFGASYFHDIRDLDKPVASLKRRWHVDMPWKLIVPHQPNLPNAKVELYNVKQDPHEKNNLAEQHPERVKQLRQQLNDWWNAKQ